MIRCNISTPFTLLDQIEFITVVHDAGLDWLWSFDAIARRRGSSGCLCRGGLCGGSDSRRACTRLPLYTKRVSLLKIPTGVCERRILYKAASQS